MAYTIRLEKQVEDIRMEKEEIKLLLLTNTIVYIETQNSMLSNY